MTLRDSRAKRRRVQAEQCWLELRTNKRTGIDIGYKERSPGYQLSQDAHDFWELLYADKGRVLIRLDGVPFQVRQGEFVLIAPGQSHSVSPSADAPFYVTAHFQTNLKGLSDLKHTVGCVDSKGRRLLEDVLAEREGRRFGSEELVCSYLLEFLILAVRRHSERPSEHPHLPTHFQQNMTDGTVERTIAFLRANFAKPLTLRGVARELGVSSSHLEHLFKKATGRPVMSYLQDLRLEQAKVLLLESTLNVTQIAARCGYSSVHLFSRRFKQLVSVPPSEYAKMLRSNRSGRRPLSASSARLTEAARSASL